MQQRANLQASTSSGGDVTSALAAMDAEPPPRCLHCDPARRAKLDHAVTTLNKVIFAAGMGDAGMGSYRNGLGRDG